MPYFNLGDIQKTLKNPHPYSYQHEIISSTINEFRHEFNDMSLVFRKT